MKKMMLILLAALMTSSLSAQNPAADSNYVTRISSVNWMPDGKDILLGIVKHHKINQQAPFFSKVYLYNVQSGQLQFLFNDGSNLAAGPGRNQLAFLKRNEKKKTDIYFFDMGTRKETVLRTDTMEKYGLQWSPDGKNLLYNILNRGDDKVDILVLNLETKTNKANYQ